MSDGNGQEKGGAIVATRGLAPRTWDEAKSQASAIAKARGFVPTAYYDNPPAVLAALMTGAELGIGPMQALRSIHVIEGKPTLSADLMLGLALRAGVRIEWLVNTPTEARARFTRPGFPDHEEHFTIQEANQAGLVGKTRKGEPNNWMKYPRAMLRARVVSAALRAWSPDVLGAGAYVAGEIEPDAAPVEAAGVWDATPEVVDAPPADALDAQLAAAEAACGAPAEPERASEPAAEPERVEAPAQLTQCTNAAELRAWCEQRGPAAVKVHGERAVKATRAHAAKLGIVETKALEWLGYEPEAA